MDRPPAIRVENLQKRFGDVEAVRGVSFVVQAGEMFGFLGPNGCCPPRSMSTAATPILEIAGGRD